MYSCSWFNNRRTLRILLAVILLWVSIAESIFADTDGYVSRIDWHIELDEIVISYDLIGSPEERYNVEIVLKRKTDRTFSFTPGLITGNVGDGQAAGVHKEIRWAYKKDILKVMSGDDFFFEMTVSKPKAFPWTIVGIGAAIGGVVAFLLTSSGDKATTSTELPYPPVRP